VTVVVCTRGRPQLLEECLRALTAQSHPEFDVLVVDNAPSNAVQEVCARWSAKWVPAPVPGLTVARNIGARAAQGDIIAYIDDDAIAEPGWLEALVEDFNDPVVAAVSGRVRYMKAMGESRAMSACEAPGTRARPWGSFDSGTPDWFTLACFGGVGDGGNMCFRRALLVSTGGFDERIGRGRRLDSGDEHVVFASLIASGYRVTHNPAAIVRHPCPSAAATLQAKRYAELRSSIAHLAFIWFEYPRGRSEILRFLGRAVARRIVPRAAGAHPAYGLSRVQALAAMCAGLGVYLQARREWAASGPALRGNDGLYPPGCVEPTSSPR
jgi:glycosyltransferase involved in cell wall biosynthesis